MDFLRFALIGIVIGMANVIPGVSGGTLAVVFNIYDKFIHAITLNVKKLAANWRFVVPILLGMASGVLIFSKLITILYQHFQVQTNFFFTGLIVGSIPLIFSFMTKRGEKKAGVLRIASIALCAAAGFALLMLFSQLEESFDKNAAEQFFMPPITLKLELRIFFAGFVGAVAMIIPGISGSLLMLILGVYPIVMYCIPALFNPAETVHAFFLLLPNGIGVIMGLLAGAQLVKLILEKSPNHAYAVIFGLLCGSAIHIFPGISAVAGAAQGAACAVCLAAGICMAFFSAKLAPET